MAINKNFIRKIAFILVFAFTLGSINLTKANANTKMLNVEFNQTLSEGMQNQTPVVVTPNLNSEQAFMYWDFTKVDGTGIVSGDFILSYALEDDTIIKFKVEKVSDQVSKAYYNIYKNGVDIGQSGIAGYQIHSNVNSGGKPNYIPVDQYLAENPNQSEQGTQVVANTDTTPEFIVKHNTGLSFRYYGRTIHFKWDNNRFIFASDGIFKGNIYDVKLEYIPITGVTKTDIKEIISGVPWNNFASVPVANDINTTPKAVAGENNHTIVYDTDNLQLDSSLVETNQPAQDEVKLVLAFDLPKRYNETTKKYEFLDITASPTEIISASLFLNHDDKNFRKTITINNILDLTKGFTESGTIGSVESIKYINRHVSSTPDSIEIILKDMEPGTLFNPTEIEFKSTNDLVAGKTSLHPASTFTFMDYKIIFENGTYYALIKPYKGIDGYYMLVDHNRTNSAIITPSKDDTPIKIPLGISSKGQVGVFQVFFSPNAQFPENGSTDDKVFSQIIDFIITSDSDSIGIPNNFYIEENYNLYPESNANTKKGKLDMTAVWDIAPTDVILNILNNQSTLELEYDLNAGSKPDTNSTEVISKVKLILRKDSSGKILVTYSVTDTKGIITNTEEMPLETRYDTENGESVYVASVDFLMDAVHKTSSGAGTDVSFRYPNIYFLNVKLVKIDGAIKEISSSLFDSITLDDITKKEIAPPQKLNAKDPITTNVTDGYPENEISFKVSFDMASKTIKDYFESLNRGTAIDFSDVTITNDIYISSDETKLRDVFSKYSYDERIANSIAVNFGTVENEDRLFFSDINNTGLDYSSVIQNFKDPLTALRSGAVLRVTGIDLTAKQIEKVLKGESLSFNFIFDGMDKNQRYYLSADTLFSHLDSDLVTTIKTASILSNLTTVLTKGDKSEPGEEEKIPPAPILNKKDEDLDKVTLYWDKINSKDENVNNEIVEYEIIRLTAEEMENNLLDTRVEFGKFFENSLPNAEKVGFRTNGDIVEVYRYGSYVPLDPELYKFDKSTGVIYFTDKTLKPNSLYFYYVRTVRITSSEERVVSTWSHISTTTSPIKNPINLEITDGLKHEPTTEFIIEFDAPIKDLDKLGIDFTLEYSLKEDTGDFGKPVRMNTSLLKANSSKATDENFVHFKYLISGLKHGTNYSIKVRMVDANNDASLYSNTATTRTDLDQGDYDDEEETGDYTEHLQQLLEKLLKKYYWTKEDNSNNLEIVYRPTMFDAYLSENIDSAINLPTSDAKTKVYYFPASTLEKLNNSNKGFKVSHGNMEIVIGANTIDQSTNEAIKKIAEDIKKGNVVDYYLKMSISFDDNIKQIDGKNVISPIATLGFEIVGSRIDISKVDSELFNEFSEMVAIIANKEINVEHIKKMVENDFISEEILTFINKVVTDTSKVFEKEVDKKIATTTGTRFIYPMESTDKAFFIIFKSDDDSQSISGHINISKTWENVSTEIYGSGKAIITNRLGKYVFTGQIINIPGLDELEGAEDLKAIIIKYDLMDFIGEGTTSLKNSITKNSLLGISARILGAKKGADSGKYLTSLGIKTNSRNLEKDISLQDTIFVIMGTYEIRSKIKVSGIQINNFNLTKDMKNLEDKNKESVRAALQIGVYDNKNMNPNEKATLEDVLIMFKNIGV